MWGVGPVSVGGGGGRRVLGECGGGGGFVDAGFVGWGCWLGGRGLMCWTGSGSWGGCWFWLSGRRGLDCFVVRWYSWVCRKTSSSILGIRLSNENSLTEIEMVCFGGCLAMQVTSALM